MTAVPEGDGYNGSDIIFHFGENYYQKNDTFIIERTRQQIIVMNRPQRINDNDYVVIGKILDDDYNSVLDTNGAYVGAATRFITNLHPEMHEEGYTKYQSNTEKHELVLCPCVVIHIEKFFNCEKVFLRYSQYNSQRRS